MCFQAPASLLLSSLSSLRPALSCSPTKPVWSVCPVSRCLLQMWAGLLVGVQWAVGSLPAPLFSNRTRLSKSAAFWPSRHPTGTWRRFTHVKCLWAPRLQRKTSTSPTVALKIVEEQNDHLTSASLLFVLSAHDEVHMLEEMRLHACNKCCDSQVEVLFQLWLCCFFQDSFNKNTKKTEQTSLCIYLKHYNVPQ